MTDTHNVVSTPIRRRLRSPSYPSIGLPEAISLARRIYEKIQTQPHDQEELAARLQYHSGSSWLGLRLSALTKFGLAEIIPANSTRGKACALTALAETLVTGNPNSEEYRSALRQAAMRPTIYHDLWTRFGPELPVNREMAAYLIDERKFNPNAVTALLAEFRATAECANLNAMRTPQARVDAATLDAYSRMRLPEAEETGTAPTTGTMNLGLGQPVMGGPTTEDLRRVVDQRVAAIPLAEGEMAIITMPKKMSPQSWRMLIDTLELWKRQASEA